MVTSLDAHKNTKQEISCGALVGFAGSCYGAVAQNTSKGYFVARLQPASKDKNV